jgi:ubiquinone/menaquinone biosynthesis C-methylase UbiE
MSSERQLLEDQSPWWAEHIHRYTEVLKIIKSTDTILDIACGTGFGSNILAKKAAQVIGGDIDKTTIAENNTIYSKDNLTFQELDGTKLPFDDNTFDVLVSFETIEHTIHYDEMIKEFKRVVKPTGKLFISTPNFYLNSPSGIVTNPFHTQEFTPDEFKELISTYFQKFEIFGQEYIRYKNKKSINYIIAHKIELFHYLRGIRKLPLRLQNIAINLLINKPQYPTLEDYTLTKDSSIIAKKCITQLAICEK